MDIKEVVDKQSLARFLGIEYKELTYILYALGVENLYQSFEIPKKSGDVRLINAPKEPLKHVQRKLALELAEIQKKFYLKSNDIAHGFIKKRGIITNSTKHRKRRYVINMDLKDFFDSFHFGRVKGFFKKNKHFMLPEEVAGCLANLVCYQGKLPQGAPSSPIITNLICAILDRRLSIVSKKYHMTYTRYADDLTFSTNSKSFLDSKDIIIEELVAEIEKCGFEVNKTKTRISFYNARQTVTGLIVNHKINIKREYYKNTRAMLNHLYRGSNDDNDVVCTPLQIEGRLAFINQIDKYNNKIDGRKKSVHGGLNARERQYQQFLFYKYFYNPSLPVIVTEGKTDSVYIRAALRSLYTQYPKLVSKNKDGSFEYKVSFLHRSSRLQFFLGIDQEGADTMKNIYNFYMGKNGFPNLYNSIDRFGGRPSHPVFLLFDNETNSKRPLNNFLNFTKVDLHGKLTTSICENLFLATVPLVKGKEECEIEDLFSDDLLAMTIDGKKFDRKGIGKEKTYSKQVFSSYIARNVASIDFGSFVPLFDAITEVIDNYQTHARTDVTN